MGIKIKRSKISRLLFQSDSQIERLVGKKRSFSKALDSLGEAFATEILSDSEGSIRRTSTHFTLSRPESFGNHYVTGFQEYTSSLCEEHWGDLDCLHENFERLLGNRRVMFVMTRSVSFEAIRKRISELSYGITDRYTENIERTTVSLIAEILHRNSLASKGYDKAKTLVKSVVSHLQQGGDLRRFVKKVIKLATTKVGYLGLLKILKNYDSIITPKLFYTYPTEEEKLLDKQIYFSKNENLGSFNFLFKSKVFFQWQNILIAN